MSDSSVMDGSNEAEVLGMEDMIKDLCFRVKTSPLTEDNFVSYFDDEFSTWYPAFDHLHLEIRTELSREKDYDVLLYNGNKEMRYSLWSKEVSKLPHEMVCQSLFNSSSDQKMSVISSLGDSSDRQTPDNIQKLLNRWVVSEVKTVKADSLCEQRFRESMEIYKDAVMKRTEVIDLFSLSISPGKIVTNLTINDTIAESCSAMYRMGIAIQDHLRESGWFPEDSEGTHDQKKLFKSMSGLTIPETSDDPLIITKEDIRRWRTLQTDQNKYLKHLKESYAEAKVETSESSASKTKIRIQDHMDSLKGGRITLKSPIQLPLFYASRSGSEESLYSSLGELTVIERLWKEALKEKFENPERWEESDKEKTLSRALSDDPAEPESLLKIDKFRVQVSLCNSDWVELSKRGVEAKVKRDVPDLIEHREREKIPLSLDCPTDDIDKFITREDLLMPTYSDNPLSLKLLPLDVMISKEKYSSTDEFTTNFFTSLLGQSLTQLQSILMEVNISRLQNCKPGTFVLKYVQAASSYVLIKPTKASEHIFFSVACPPGTTVFGKPFKECMVTHGGWKIFDFVSSDTNRLTHAIACPERSCALLAMWAQLYDTLPKYSFDPKEKDIREHFLASFLFYMEDKETTSSSLQAIRYAYMEMVKGPNRHLDPLKVLSKMHERPRSRLLIWAIKRVYATFSAMVEQPPTYGLRTIEEMASESSQDVAHNLLSWVTMRPIPKFEIALNLSYMGVLHNKEEGDKIHGFLKIFEKVIKEERELKYCNQKYMGKEEPPENHKYRSHEFSPSFVAQNGRAVKSFLEKKGGGLKWLFLKIENMLTSKSLLELATMKASAIEIKETNFEPGLRLNKRQKTAESVKDMMDVGIEGQYMYNIDKIYRQVKLDGGIRANLFKKLQIGGTREIFVLNMQSRMLVHFCESICRSVCEELPNEMLTKGDQKLMRNDSHFKKLGQINGENSITVTSSDDATTWAQRFVMPAFACFLCQIFPDEFMEPIAAVLNECTNKKLELPSELLSLFYKNPNVNSFSDQINELKHQFFGTSESSDLMEPRSVLLKNRSNMMQGIFHYTSSLFHAGFLLQWSNFSSEVIQKACPFLEDHVITTKVSSDDSSVLISTRFHREKQRRKLSLTFYSLTLLKKALYKYMCCKQSEEKSTVGVFWTIEEFNSNWLMRNTILMPLIKFVVSATQVHVTPKIESRLHVMATLRSQVVENCGSILLASIVQRCQSRLHYLSLGAMTNKMWSYFVDYLADVPHPSCGFMPLEPDTMCGILGYDFSLYSWLMISPKARRVHERLVKNLGIEFSKDGSQNSRVFLSHGQNIKYADFLKKMGLEDKRMFIEDTNDIITREPSVLYRQPMTSEEFRLKLLIKCSDPEMSQSFSFLNASKIYASSVYILQEPCMHLINGFNSDGSVKIQKCSLLKWVRLVRENLREGDDDFVKLSFPSWQFYDRLLEENNKISGRPLVPCYRRRRIFITVPIPKQSTLTPMTLVDCLKRLWFSLPVRGSTTSCNATFEYFKKFYPWLSTSYTETLKNGPFSTHTSLHKFVTSLSPTSKCVRIATPSRSLQSGVKTILDAMLRNQWPSHVVLEDEIRSETVDTVTDSLMYSLWLLKNAPPLVPPTDLIKSICREVPQIMHENPNLADIMTQGLDRFNVMMTQYAVLNPSKAIDMLIKYNRGVFGGYTVRQTFEDGKYKGKGIYSGSIDGQRFQAFMNDGDLHTLKVESLQSFLPKISTFLSFVRDQKLVLKAPKELNSRFLNVRGEVGQWNTFSCRVIEGDVPYRYDHKDVVVDCDVTGRIRLRTRDRFPVTILSYIPAVRTSSSSIPIRKHYDDPLMHSWNNFEPISIENAYDLMERRELDSLQEWLFKSLTHKLSSMGFDVFRLPTVSSVIEVPVANPREEVAFDMDDEFGDMDFDFFFESGEDETEDEDFVTAEINDSEGMDELYNTLTNISDDMIIRQPIKKKIEPNVFRTHPFWESLIDDLIDLCGAANVQKAVMGVKVRGIEINALKCFLDYCSSMYMMYENA